jgi:hypothetical protein
MKKIKGEITTQQIVLLIILLVSFVVILFLLFRLDLGRESDIEICHNSVVMKGTPGLPADSTSLKCSREYICITKDGSCEGMTKPEIIKAKTKEEVYNILAEEMANCWWKFGEGKVDYIGKDFFIRDNYCSVWSQVAFDNSIKEIQGLEEQISKDEFYNYLALTPVPDKGVNYAEYLFRTNNVNELKSQKLIGEDGTETIVGTFGNINLDKPQFILMGITSEVTGRGWKIAAAGVVATVGFFIPGPGWTWSGAIIGTLIVGVGEVTKGIQPEIGAIIIPGDGVKNSFMAPTIQEANSDSLKKLNCYDIITTA